MIRAPDSGSKGPSTSPFADPSEVERALAQAGYLADRALATAILIASRLSRPFLVEGEPGVGKTELAKALSRALGSELIRLQCYEGIEATEALYEWDWRRQLLAARLGAEHDAEVDSLYASEFLLERPLLTALRSGPSAVLLIDELDRADDAFEGFLLEVLSDFTVSVPEFGTIHAEQPPLVVITSNRTRELHDALTRRCIYHWIDYPDVAREVEIIRLHAPGVEERLARSVAEAVARLRALDLVKRPGAAEAIDWAEALVIVGAESVTGNPDEAAATLGSAIKQREDLDYVRNELPQLLGG